MHGGMLLSSDYYVNECYYNMDYSVSCSHLIEANTYIVIQRRGYFKLHQLLNENRGAMLGKDKVDLKTVIGKPFWSMFRMVPLVGKKREFDLELCSRSENLSEDILKVVSSGIDNRNITDDGSSQLLSSDDINGMRESGLSGQVILEKIVENSKTFKEKTEYSQEKYLKKKERKYSEYIIIRKPTLRLISDILYNKDQAKIMGLRHDTLSQLLTAANLQHDGVYALFENGSQALVGAGILNFLSDKGLLINMSVGVNPQKQAISALNYKKEDLYPFVNVRIKDFINVINSKEPEQKNKIILTEEKSEESTVMCDITTPSDSSLCTSVLVEEASVKVENGSIETALHAKESVYNKRKLSFCETESSKKPRWAEDFERATDAIKQRKLNGIIIVAKEYPLNIITHLLPFLKPSCQLVVYCVLREPLVQLYIELKKRRDVIGLHLTENWLRMYQVLPDRTHPDVNMTLSGHLLTATKVL